jgi:YVTN family beta-propeller protein
VAVSIGSNTVGFIDTTTNAVKDVTYVGRPPHEAFFTPDGKEVWVTVRGEDYLAGASTHLTLANRNGDSGAAPIPRRGARRGRESRRPGATATIAYRRPK